MDFKKLYSDYKKLNPNHPFITSSFLNSLSRSVTNVKLEIFNIINESIAQKDKANLRFALYVAYRDGIDSSYIEIIARLLTATWHDEHEDLINSIYLENLNDDIFTDSLYKIATEPNIYRKYDDEMESTLRKCIHALKTIDSEKANAFIGNLRNTKNNNIDMVLSMYNN